MMRIGVLRSGTRSSSDFWNPHIPDQGIRFESNCVYFSTPDLIDLSDCQRGRERYRMLDVEYWTLRIGEKERYISPMAAHCQGTTPP